MPVSIAPVSFAALLDLASLIVLRIGSRGDTVLIKTARALHDGVARHVRPLLTVQNWTVVPCSSLRWLHEMVQPEA